jgi:hypothetical protein
MKIFRKPLLIAVALVLGLSACNRAVNQTASKGLKSEGSESSKGNAPAAGAPAQTDTSAGGAAPAAAPDQATSQSQEIPPIPPGTPGDLSGQKVIKNATLELEVPRGDFQDRFGRASDVAQQFGGFVSGNRTTETKGRVASGSVTIRVPSDKFDAALKALRRLGRVKEEVQTGEDVSQEFVDLEARLRHAKAEEAFYLKLLDKATTISDSIQIQGQLSQVQLQLEQIQGRLNYLNSQTSFSTVIVRMFEPGVERATPRGLLAKAWANGVRGFQSVIAGIIVLLMWLAPLVILALLGVLLWRVLRRRPSEPKATGQSG